MDQNKSTQKSYKNCTKPIAATLNTDKNLEEMDDAKALMLMI